MSQVSCSSLASHQTVSHLITFMSSDDQGHHALIIFEGARVGGGGVIM